jgi:hypothetical protein
LAGTPTPLTDKQVDNVTAGYQFLEVDLTNVSAVLVAVNEPLIGCIGCYLFVQARGLQIEA